MNAENEEEIEKLKEHREEQNDKKVVDPTQIIATLQPTFPLHTFEATFPLGTVNDDKKEEESDEDYY